MKRLIGGLAVALVLVGCTPNQQAAFQAALGMVQATEDPADDAALKAGVEAYLATKAQATAGRPCAEWYDYAIEAGFTPEQWEWPLSQTMYGESHCNPHADSPISTARGLMQHLRMWADDCGGTYESFYDPAFSLACAKHVHGLQGWGAWQAAPAGA